MKYRTRLYDRPIWILAVGLLFWAPFSSWAALPTFTASPTITSMELADGLQYHIDQSDALSINDLLEEPDAVLWRDTGQRAPNFGFDKHTYWYRLSLQVASGLPPLLLQVDNSLLDQLDVHIVQNGKLVKSYHTGDAQPFSQRPLQNRSFLFPLDLAGQHVELYLRVKTDSPQSLPLTLWHPEAFDQQDRTVLMAHSFYFGIVFVMIIYNLAMFFSVRDVSYLLYVASVAAFALFDASMNGFAFQFFWPNATQWNDKGPMFFLNLFILFRAIFVFSFLNMGRLGPLILGFHRAFLFFTFISLGSVFVAPISVAITLGLTLGFVGLLAGQLEGILLWVKGKQYARFFVAGWSVFMISLLIHLFAQIGVAPVNIFTSLMPQVGSAIEIILFTFALADRVRLVHQERDDMERQANQALQAANRSLEESLRVKNDFLATISHELRTPMNGVIASLDHISNSQTLEEAKRFCLPGSQSAQEMMGMVEGILGYTEMQSGQFELEQLEFSLRKLCEHLKREYQSRADARGLRLNVNVADSVPDRLLGDPRRLSQILGCLIDNAIKFTPQGHIALSADSSAPNAAADSNNIKKVLLRIRISDTGIGVPPEQRERIFQKFHQADGSYQRSFGGLGLGLSLSQTLVTAMGGELVYEPASGTGSQFTVLLDVTCLPERRQNRAARAEAPLPHSTRILLVEDNDVNQMVMKTLIQKLGAEVVLAENGEVAVNLAQSEHFDLILMDLQMPVMDGFEATQRIRSLGGPASSTPIVAVTANVMDSDRRRCRECGIDEVVSKPVRREKLIEVFTKWLRNKPEDLPATTVDAAPPAP